VTTLNIKEQADVQGRDCLHAVGERLENSLPLIDGVAGHEHRMVRIREQFSDNDTGITISNGRHLGASRHQLQHILNAWSSETVCSQKFERYGNLFCTEAACHEGLKVVCKALGNIAGNNALQSDGCKWGREAARAQG